jgi:hypothetical protein
MGALQVVALGKAVSAAAPRALAWANRVTAENQAGLQALFRPPAAGAVVDGGIRPVVAGARALARPKATSELWGILAGVGNAVLSSRWDDNQLELFPGARPTESIHGHHTWPKALGGHPDQPLSPLLGSTHLGPSGVHSALATFEGGWLYPVKGMTGAQILAKYGEDAVVEGLRRFYSQPKWQHLLKDFENSVAYTKWVKGA